MVVAASGNGSASNPPRQTLTDEVPRAGRIASNPAIDTGTTTSNPGACSPDGGLLISGRKARSWQLRMLRELAYGVHKCCIRRGRSRTDATRTSTQAG